MSQAFDVARLKTVQLVPVTAFDSQGRLALEPMRLSTRRMVEAGIRCIIPCAGSSEFHSLSADEIVSVIAMTRETAGDDVVVMAPVGLQLSHALEVGRRSLDAGADCLLVMPMSFPYIADSGCRDYFQTLLDELHAPTLIYKKDPIPGDGLLMEMAHDPRVVGVKYAVNDIDAFNRVIQDDTSGIGWYCGSAERFSPFFMLAGAPGYTSGAGNLCPRVTLAMHAAAVAGDWDEVFRWQKALRPIEDYRGRGNNSYNISFLKYAMRHVKVDGQALDFGEPRPPQRRLTEAERREVDAIVPELLAVEESLAVASA